MFAVMTVAVFLFLLGSLPAVEGDNSYYFRRNVKWTNLPPSGGSLVSGRGNFRPGFVSRSAAVDPRMFINEPLFAIKRSYLQDAQQLERSM
ncbi:Protein Y67D8B.4 b [Aphelenchoides avenae]|nr:Protein Y67D8B.4 b [Aphelenchus avenae]